MAIILLGELVTGIRGTIGGTTYSANAAGPFAKRWSRPGRPTSPYITNRNATLAYLAAIWQTLSTAEKGDWQTLADEDPEPRNNALGQPIAHTGIQYYYKLNARLMEMGLDIQPTNPYPFGPVIPGTLVDADMTIQTPPLGISTVTWTDYGEEPDCYAVLYAAAVPQANRPPTPNRYAYIQHAPTGDYTMDISEALYSRFGMLQTGWTLHGLIYQRHMYGIDGAPQPNLAIVEEP